MDVRDLVSRWGELDEATAGALCHAVGDPVLNSLHWVGRSDSQQAGSPHRMFGEDCFEGCLTSADILAGVRAPGLAWDDECRLAWGGRLCSDSLIAAAKLNIFQRLIGGPRLGTISVVTDRGVLPGSSVDCAPCLGQGSLRSTPPR